MQAQRTMWEYVWSGERTMKKLGVQEDWSGCKGG